MQKNNLLKKTLVIVILSLFIGTTLVSALDINSENETVTTEISQLDLNDGLIGYWSFDFFKRQALSCVGENGGRTLALLPVSRSHGKQLFDPTNQRNT